MHISFAFIWALVAARSVLSNPFPVVERAPEPKLLYAKDFASGASIEKRAISECQAVNAVVNALKAVSKVAYPFCSSYIHIPVVTSTISSTTTVTPNPVTTTTTVTPAAVVITVSTTITSTDPGSTTTIYSHYTPPVTKVKRAAHTLPPYVSAFGASQVSKACSCLSISPSSTTVTTTAGTTLPPNTITATATAAVPTSTVTSSSVITVAGSTTTIPALCAPSIVSSDTSGVLSTAGNDEPTLVTKSGITDISSCCVACLGTQNCLSYFLSSGTCDLFVAVDPSSPSTGNAAQAAICPLGVNAQDTIFPSGVVAPESGDSAFHIGPCLTDATPLI